MDKNIKEKLEEAIALQKQEYKCGDFVDHRTGPRYFLVGPNRLEVNPIVYAILLGLTNSSFPKERDG